MQVTWAIHKLSTTLGVAFDLDHLTYLHIPLSYIGHFGHVQNQCDDSNLLKFVQVQIHAKHFAFRIKSRSARKRLTKIRLYGEIFESDAQDDACYVNVANQ